jgi:DNA polymerase I-like protein with 3'-5' exonuclease and polymerase domains
VAILRDYISKDIMLITDFPLVKEAESGNAYSEHSSTQMKDALIKASVIECKNREKKHIIGVNEICLTYLSLERPAKGDGDWAKSICNKKQIPSGEEENYVQLEWLKDVWVTKEVRKSIDGLLNQIRKVSPRLVILAGKWSFFLLASLVDNNDSQLATIAGTKSTFKKQLFFGGLNKFRASLLTFNKVFDLPPMVVIPILTPSYHWVIKDKAVIIQRDYAKIASYYRRLMDGESPEDIIVSNRINIFPNSITGHNKDICTTYLKNLLDSLEQEQIKVVFDVETRQGFIDCIGICYEKDISLTIPFTELYYETTTEPSKACINKTVNGKKQRVEVDVPVETEVRKYRHFWAAEDEVEITHLLHKVMLHPNCLHVGQNYTYDCQFYYRDWKLSINAFADTMIQHHVLYNYMQKDLALLASMYCMNYTYWKDEIDAKDNFTRWKYNGKDVCYTLEIENILGKLLERSDPKLLNFYHKQQYDVSKNIVKLMNRGVPVDKELKDKMLVQFSELMDGCLEKLRYVFNEPEFNPNSTPQVKAAFKDLLGIKPLVNRKTKAESFGADAMLVYLEEYPEWRAVLTLFLEYKSIKVFVKTFLSAKISSDGNMRCSYNVAGTKTYRLASRKNIDGEGLNLQNVPSKGKIKLHYALQELGQKDEDSEEDVVNDGTEDDGYIGTIELPNCKKMFVPPKDYIFFDADYSAIDLMFVIWESDCKFLKEVVKAGKDVYSMLASEYYGREINKKDWERQIFKAVCHATNYLGRPTTIAAKAGLSVPNVKKVQDFYFRMCPEILAWHRRLENEARTRGYITNVFGARCWAIDTTDPMWMNKLVAWQPQSSAGILVNTALCLLEEEEKGKIQVLMQVHDSLAGIFHKDDTTAVQRIKEYMELTIPYDDPLVIPAAIKTSPISYGDCV